MNVTFPDGTIVQATSLGRPDADSEPDFGLYLDRRWSPTWPHEHIKWKDFGLPEDATKACASIIAAYRRARAGERIEVGCLGGIGRTGTVLACMATLAGVDASEAVAWVRDNYLRSAVETPEQESFVASFAGSLTEEES